MSDVKEVKHLKVVDLSERLEEEKKEAKKLPPEVLKDLERLVEGAKAGKLKQAIIFFSLEDEVTATPIEEADKEEESFPNDPFFFFYEQNERMTDLHFTSEFIKNYLYDLCISLKLGEPLHDDHDH